MTSLMEREEVRDENGFYLFLDCYLEIRTWLERQVWDSLYYFSFVNPHKNTYHVVRSFKLGLLVQSCYQIFQYDILYGFSIAQNLSGTVMP